MLVRAVRERRRELGMLRAIGVEAAVARRSFLVESAFVGGQGVLLGTGLGLLSAWQIFTKSTAFEEGLEFAMPVLDIAAMSAIALLASLAAGVIPALRAGRISPAEALRIAG